MEQEQTEGRGNNNNNTLVSGVTSSQQQSSRATEQAEAIRAGVSDHQVGSSADTMQGHGPVMAGVTNSSGLTTGVHHALPSSSGGMVTQSRQISGSAGLPHHMAMNVPAPSPYSGGMATASYPRGASSSGVSQPLHQQIYGSRVIQASPVGAQQHAHYTASSHQSAATGAVFSSSGSASVTASASPIRYHHSSALEHSTTTSRVVTGEERVIGYNTHVQEERILSERIIEHEIKVPKRIIREEVIEKVIVVPETVVREEVVEEVQLVKETIIEVAKPVIQEKVVEVDEIEYRDKYVDVIEKIVQEKIKEVPRVEYQERIVEVPKVVTQERVVEVPEIEYKEVIVEKIVEVPDIREQYVYKEVQVPHYVDKPVPEYVQVENPVDVPRNLPVPVEAVTSFEYQLAQFRPRVNKVQYPLYVPRFVEVPVAAELFDTSVVAQLQHQASRLRNLTAHQAIGLCDVENMATDFRRTQLQHLTVSDAQFHNSITQAFSAGRLEARHAARPVHRIQA